MTFSDTDLAQAMYLASRGSIKVILCIIGDVVHRFTAHAHRTHVYTMSPRERFNILWECLALIDVLGAVAGSAQSADRTFKITFGIFTGKNVKYPIVSSTFLNMLIIIKSNIRFKITFCCQ